MKLGTNAVAMVVAMHVCAVALAAEVTVDTTLPLTADSDASYEIADGVTLTVEVAEGATNTLSGCIAGTGTAALTDGALSWMTEAGLNPRASAT